MWTYKKNERPSSYKAGSTGRDGSASSISTRVVDGWMDEYAAMTARKTKFQEEVILR